MTTDPTTLALLRDAESYLSALHGSVARHDHLAANLACAGCELRDRIAAALPTLTAVVPVSSPPADRAAVLREAADDLATAFGDPMAKHIGALGASHLRRRAREIEAGQAGEAQPETPLEKRLRYSERRNDELRAECKRRGKRVLEQSETIIALERELDEVRRQLGAEILRAGQAETELRRMADETPAAEEAGALGLLASALQSTDRPDTPAEARVFAAHILGMHARELASGARPAIEEALASPLPTIDALTAASEPQQGGVAS